METEITTIEGCEEVGRQVSAVRAAGDTTDSSGYVDHVSEQGYELGGDRHVTQNADTIQFTE